MKPKREPPKPYWSEENPEPFYQANEADNWYLYRVAGGQEREAERMAKRCGLVAIVPMETRAKKRRRSRDKRAQVMYPMVSGYLFLAVRSIFDRIKALQVPSIGPAITCDGRYVAITSAEMGLVLARNGHSIPHQQSVNMRKGLSVGDGAKVVEGPFVDKGGKVASVDVDHGTLEIIFDILGIDRPIRFSLDVVEAL